jgi:hypothetical protein
VASNVASKYVASNVTSKAGVSFLVYRFPNKSSMARERSGMDDWLARHIMLLGIQFQNWMVVTLALILIAALIKLGETSRGG